MDNLLQWSDTFARRGAYNEQKGRDALTESIGQQRAFKSGASFNDGLMAGSRFVEEQKDPLFELRKMQAQSQINAQSAQMADHYRKLQLDENRILNEQEDQNYLTQSAIEANGDWKVLKDKMINFTPKTIMGAREQQIKLNAIAKAGVDAETTKLLGKLDTKTFLTVKQELDKTGGEWTPEVYELARASVAEQEQAKIKNIEPKPTTIDLGDGTTMTGVYNPATGSFTKYTPEKNNAVDSGIKMLESDISKMGITASKAKAEYEGLLAADPDSKESATKSAFGTYTSLQNDLLRKQSQLNKLKNPPAPKTVPAVVEIVPTQSDIDFLKAHPELKAKFELKFGAGSAADFTQ